MVIDINLARLIAQLHMVYHTTKIVDILTSLTKVYLRCVVEIEILWNSLYII